MNTPNTRRNTIYLQKTSVIFLVLITLAGCKPELDILTITDSSGNSLNLVPAFDTEVTEYVVDGDYPDDFIYISAVAKKSDDRIQVYSNRLKLNKIFTEPLQPEDDRPVYITEGNNHIALYLKNKTKDNTYHITVHRPYAKEEELKRLFETAISEEYAASENMGQLNYGNDVQNVGLSAAIYLPDGRSFSTTRGVNRATGETPITEDHLFPVASMTKSFVAALALQMIREYDTFGLTLDDTIGQWLTEEELPDPIYIPRTITVKQLLRHRSGLPRQEYTKESVLDNLFVNWTADKWVKRRAIEANTPGHYNYADINYWLAGLILDRALQKADSKNDVYKEIRKRFLIPLNLKNTYFATESFPKERLARGHYHDYQKILGGGLRPNPFHQLPLLNNTDSDIVKKSSYAGAMVSNAEDIARWLNAFLHDEHNYYSHYNHQEDLEILTHAEREEIIGQEGFGIETLDIYGASDGLTSGHYGDLGIYGGQMIYHLQTGTVVVLLVNQGVTIFDGYIPDYWGIQGGVISAFEPYLESLAN